jgi:hypothetical protein
VKFNHRAIEQEGAFMREALCDDLVSGGQPLVQCENVDIGHDQIYVCVCSRWLQPEKLFAPSTNERNLEASRFDELEGIDRERTAIHRNSLTRARTADRR